MEKSVTELYGGEDLEGLRSKIRFWSAVMAAIAVLALGVNIYLAATTRTANAMRNELAAVAVSTVAGWAALYIGIFTVTGLRRELAHGRMLRAEARERIPGSVRVTEERIRIHKSITAARVEVSSAEGVRRVLVCESRAKALAASGASAVYTAHGFVAAYEVEK